jgi:glycosyltransferase involved in cell wall biosynthesis
VRVIQVAPTPFGAGGLLGGGERYPLELARALAAHVDSQLLTFGWRAQVEREPSGLRRRTLRALGWLGGHPAHPVAPGLFAAVSGAHVIHTHHMRSLPSQMLVLARRRQRLVVTDHGLQGLSLRQSFDRFLLVSAYSGRELGAPSDRTRVIYGGADPTRFFPDERMVRSGVLFVGRLTPHKGVDRLIRALPAGVRLDVVGSTGHDPRLPERDYPDLLKTLARGRDVRFVGPLPEEDLPRVYRSAAVLALPSVERTCFGRSVRVSELLGLAALEAMASGTPVVASRVGGLPEIIEDGVTGFLVPPGDEFALRERLSQVVHDPGLGRRLGRRARDVVCQRFTWQAVAGRCLEEYVASPRRGRIAGR